MGAFMTTGLVFLTLAILSRMENKDYSSLVSLLVTTIDAPGQIGEIGSYLGGKGIHIRDIKIMEKNDMLEIILRVHMPKGTNKNQVTTDILAIKGISSIKILT